MKIVFMGTPEFAVASLRALHAEGHEILTVVTVPDKPKGRGLKIRFSAVKVAAIDLGIAVLQPEDLSSSGFRNSLAQLNADLFVVVAFRILPASIFEIPEKGTVNLHSSLLPKLRGAAPINWAIINGFEQTGVTTIYINKVVDAGDMILQKAIPVTDTETAGELHDRLASLGAQTLVESVKLIGQGKAPRMVQSGETTKAPKITREICRIDWSLPAENIRNLIRGLNPYPGAFSFLGDRIIKVQYAVHSDFETTEAHKPGTVVFAEAKSGKLVVQTGDGLLQIEQLQPAGKKSMAVKDFLLGYQLAAGDRFGEQ